MGQFKHTHKMLKICLILTTLSLVVFSTQLEDIADVRRGAARDPKLFFVSSSSTTSTISTSTLCYSTIGSVTTCPGRKKKRAIMEAIDHDTPVDADKVSSLESGMEEVESANQRQGKFLLYWLTTTTTTTFTATATLILSCVPTGFSECG